MSEAKNQDLEIIMGFPSVSAVKNPPAMQEVQGTRVQSLGQEIPWRRAWQPTPVFLPGKSKDREARWASPRGRQEGDTTKATEHHTHVGQWQGPRARSSGTLCEM